MSQYTFSLESFIFAAKDLPKNCLSILMYYSFCTLNFECFQEFMKNTGMTSKKFAFSIGKMLERNNHRSDGFEIFGVEDNILHLLKSDASLQCCHYYYFFDVLGPLFIKEIPLQRKKEAEEHLIPYLVDKEKFSSLANLRERGLISEINLFDYVLDCGCFKLINDKMGVFNLETFILTYEREIYNNIDITGNIIPLIISIAFLNLNPDDFIYFLNKFDISSEEIQKAILSHGFCFYACSNFELKNLEIIVKKSGGASNEDLICILIHLGGVETVNILESMGVKNTYITFSHIIKRNSNFHDYLHQIIPYLSGGKLLEVKILQKFVDNIDYLIKIDGLCEFEEFTQKEKLVLEEVKRQIKKIMLQEELYYYEDEELHYHEEDEEDEELHYHEEDEEDEELHYHEEDEEDEELHYHEDFL